MPYLKKRSPLGIPTGGAVRYAAVPRLTNNMMVSRQGMMGLGGPSDCGAGQIWDPNFVYGTLPPGQCVTQAQSTANQQANPSQYSGSSVADDVLKGLVSVFSTPAPTAVPVVATGMSTTTMVMIAGVGVLAFALIMKRSSGD